MSEGQAMCGLYLLEKQIQVPSRAIKFLVLYLREHDVSFTI
jgi:hypothetical protein